MPTKTPRTRGKDNRPATHVCGPLNHPLRVRILEVANLRPVSPVGFIEEGLLPEGFSFPTKAKALSGVSYHFRVLEKAKCIGVIETHQRRGATEHVYSGTADINFTTEEFAQLPLYQREMFSITSLRGLVARADSSMHEGVFDSRLRHMVWFPLELDEQAWSELAELLDEEFGKVQQIAADSKVRLTRSGGEPISATYAALAFPSPEPPIEDEGQT